MGRMSLCIVSDIYGHVGSFFFGTFINGGVLALYCTEKVNGGENINAAK